MGWKTIYISGRDGFEDEVLKELARSGFPHMPGTPEGENLYIFWIEDKSDVDDLKKAIGAKLVFKYRLRFFTSHEEYLGVQGLITPRSRLTAKEEEMIGEMKAWEKKRGKLQV